MRRTLLTAAVLVLAPAMGWSAGLVKNGDFTTQCSVECTRPAAWSAPADSPWQWTNEDGHSGKEGLRYRSRRAVSTGPVAQSVVLKPKTDYVLSVSLKRSAALKPVVRVRASGGKELTRVAGQADAGRWKRQSTRFNSGAATRAVIEIWADARQVNGKAAPAGEVVADNVQLALASAADASGGARTAGPTYKNLARGKRYTFSPGPGYRLCTDPGDKTQLTDGQYTNGYFWTQKSTVGWSRSCPVVITLDLGADQPIRGLAYNTAAGVAGVTFPASIFVLVSVDGRAYHDMGDLVALSAKHGVPPTDKYSVHRFWTDRLKVHGRYVKLVINPAGPYCFVDEIEVYEGDRAWLSLALPGKPIRRPMEYFDDNILNSAVKRRIGIDLIAARQAVTDSGLSGSRKAPLLAEVVKLEQAIGKLPKYEVSTFKAVFPLNDVHARVFALHGAVRAAQGKGALVAWAANPWDFLAPTDLPASPARAAVRVAAMRGESRAAAVNLTNCTDKAQAVKLSFENLPGGPCPDYVAVHQVAWTDTREGVPVAAALPEVKAKGGAYPIDVPAGMTRQVWLTVTPRTLEAGTHKGSLVIAGPAGAQRAPVAVRVFDFDFPARPTLHAGGWDYTDADSMYGVTRKNRTALIAHLRSRYVDSPWGTSACMPHGAFNAKGEYKTKPSTKRFDIWIKRWPNARRYCVYNAVRDHIAGTKIGSPLFAKQVGQWIRFWVAHARSKGIRPEQLHLLLVDEPHRNEQDRTIIAWAKAVKAAEPNVVLWEDPTYRDPTKAVPEMMAIADVLCPNRPMMLAQGKPFVEFYRKQREAGRRLDLYSCSGPGRLLDPYAYHRLQAWSAFEMGAESTFFWAFGDTGRGDSWNEYASKRTSYTPVFLSPDSVTAGKHMEAIRESVADFEYLTMLRAAVAKTKPGHPNLADARKLLAAAASRVLADQDAKKLGWKDDKDRSVADTVRIEIGEMLEKLR